MNSYALIIGAGGDLPNTVEDALGLAQILADPSRGNIPHEQIVVLTGENAARAQILAALDQLAQIDPGGTVILYFSGHGYLAESSMGQSYFLMPNGYDTNALFKTAISGREFADKLAAISAPRLLLLLDCCHAGGVADDRAKAPGLTLTKEPLPPEAQTLFAQGGGRILIASSRAGELSFAGKPYSLFTRALIECFSGQGVAKNDGFVRGLDLALYAREKVPAWSGDRQHPIADIERADNFVVAHYAGGAKEPQPLPLPPVDVAEVERLNAAAIQQTMGNIDLRGSQGTNIGVTGPITQTFGPLTVTFSDSESDSES